MQRFGGFVVLVVPYPESLNALIDIVLFDNYDLPDFSSHSVEGN